MMTLSAVVLFLVFNAVEVLARRCLWHPTYNTDSIANCDWGCCYSQIYPCCDTPFYASTHFIVIMSILGFAFFVGVLYAILSILRRKCHCVTTVQDSSSPELQGIRTTHDVTGL
ncbi:uncharacterized protein LOC106052384 [Biomphalaria glabrata]|uniref:Uncharacterized protein LOC106052384 n=1 Tax=Biomphalaria glabrata TaxID=6526 RepID=A0A9W3AYT3_BIOGL|nr:uncharacterized protein LOC106052384 [Biomphalaria glabrata]